MQSHKPLPPLAELQAEFIYDAATGDLRRKRDGYSGYELHGDFARSR